MKNANILWKRIAIISLILNLVFLCIIGIYGVYKISISGGGDYLSNDQYDARLSMFELSDEHTDVIFLGDSLTERCNFQEFFPSDISLLNRGIGGDTSEGVLNRLSEILVHQPCKIFLMIGINDLRNGYDIDSITENVEHIIEFLNKNLPNCTIYLQSVLPAEKTSLAKIEKINFQYEEISEKFDSCFFIDICSSFINENKELILSYFSNDGLHLNGDGYAKWISIINNYVVDKGVES